MGPETWRGRAALLALAAASFAVRFWALRSTGEPWGADGWYYVVQGERLASTGQLHAPDSSWALGLLGALTWIVEDGVLALHLLGAILATACVPAAWWAGRGGAAGLALASWAAASPTLGHLAAEHPKNLAVVPALLLGWAWRERPLLGLVALAAAGTAHRTGAALGALALVGVVLERRRSAWLLLLLPLPLLLAVPGLLSPEDLGRVHLQAAPELSPLRWLSLRSFPIPELVELALLPWLGLAAATRARSPALLLPLGACLLPFWEGGSLDLGYRLSLLAVPLGALALAPAAEGSPRAALALLLPALALAPTGMDPAANPPNAHWREVVARVPRPLPTLLIAPPGFNFLYDHLTGAEAMAWAPEPELPREGIARLAWDLPPDVLADLDPPPVRVDEDGWYLREAQWEAILREADPELLDRLRADPRNPMEPRPAWLTRGR